jgi:hypothetical protein
MPPFTQAKMLRALEEGVIERVGSEREQEVDVRVVAATNVALEQAVQQRRSAPISTTASRSCGSTSPRSASARGTSPCSSTSFVAQFARRYEKPVRRLTPEALKVLEEYHWPGNVRELRNVIERLVIESAGEVIGARALSRWMEEREYLIPGEWNADAFYAPRSPIIASAAPDNATVTGTGEDGLQGLPRAGEPFWGTATPAYAEPRRALPPRGIRHRGPRHPCRRSPPFRAAPRTHARVHRAGLRHGARQRHPRRCVPWRAQGHPV